MSRALHYLFAQDCMIRKRGEKMNQTDESMVAGPAGGEDKEASIGPESGSLAVQAIIWQEQGSMTRAELEEYADELEKEGLFSDGVSESTAKG